MTWNKDDACVPFDIKHLRYFPYIDSEAGCERLENTLQEAMHEKTY
ncbi:MAG TPA: hypothetical protein VE544_06490 [Nitrososphaeraceae archaeon]|nr:hypothetical protein [Nitrososphaeraceae archaeon]